LEGRARISPDVPNFLLGVQLKYLIKGYNMDDSEQQSSEQQPKKGYGKRPMWQWVVIYLVVAIIVYGLIYYVFFRDGNGGGTGISY
jgi:hypothetical protein